ncbi:CU044_5270 family protein [Actinomadura sp. 6N118]|uniref:CU044_5270 family protein n=1 Tax=Actinomadura sp. 6N118 TaxID=3375151 RepID=UPI00379DBB36
MDELKMVKELRRATPAMPDAVEDLVRGRLRTLATETNAPEPRPNVPRRRRTVLRLGLAGALAAAMAGGITVAQTVGGTPSAVPIANASELGDRAATAVENQPYTPPRPKQWIYTRSVTATGFDMNRPWKGVDLKGRESAEGWVRADGKATAEMVDGKLQVDHDITPENDKEKTPSFHLGNYSKLPTEPNALLRTLYADPYVGGPGGQGHQSVFETMSWILEDPLPPKLRAAIYRALPKVSGVELRRDVVDAAGRKGAAFSRTDERGDRKSIVLDPATFRYLGTRYEVAREHTDKAPNGATVTYKVGTILGWYASIDQKIVGSPGQRS